MDHAELNGKVAGWLCSHEDILTSSAFGLLEFIRPELALIPWLSRGRNLDGEEWTASEISEVAFRYWPRFPELGDQTELDLLLTLRSQSGMTQLLGIEVKYWSGPSGLPTEGELSEDVSGQLGREWRIVSRIRQDALTSLRHLFYLTPEARTPRETLRSMCDEVSRKHGEAEGAEMRRSLYWLSWLDLAPVLDAVSQSGNLMKHEALAVQRLRRLLSHRRLHSLSGFRTPVAGAAMPWVYAPAQLDWRKPRTMPLDWTYESQDWDWALRPIDAVAYRYAGEKR